MAAHFKLEVRTSNEASIKGRHVGQEWVLSSQCVAVVQANHPNQNLHWPSKNVTKFTGSTGLKPDGTTYVLF